MLHTPLSHYKNNTTLSLSAKRAPQCRRDSSEHNNAFDFSETRQTLSSRGTTTSSFQRSLSLRSYGLSRFTSTPLSKKDVTNENLVQPFTSKHGRRYLRDVTLPYPLPTDHAEIHRQTLRTMLLCQVFNGPLCSSFFKIKPPTCVLEVACGTGYWSELCHRHFSQQGWKSISFTGIDIAPLAIPDKTLEQTGMNWRFVQHDLRQVPLPFEDEEFSIVMIKDLSMVTPAMDMEQILMDEYLRILKPGGALEIWDADHSIRMLSPQTRNLSNEQQPKLSPTEINHKNPTGTYVLTPQTSFTVPRNPYLSDYNIWISKILESRNLACLPCTTMLSLLTQESDVLQDINSYRLAIPLGEIRWENELTNETDFDNKYASKDKSKVSESKFSNATQKALRRTALMTFIQMIESLEPLLCEASGKEPDEWDQWMENMMNDLLQGNGASWGECLEVGAWWAKKKTKF